MTTVTVEVDVDLDQIDTEDLLDELKHRKSVSFKEVTGASLGIQTLDKQMAFEFFMENLEKITLENLEQIVKFK